jgi:hypothetical protein
MSTPERPDPPKVYTYAQEYGGQRLHLVQETGGGYVRNEAICGRTNAKRGGWRMTINAPLANLCGNCRRVWRSVR